MCVRGILALNEEGARLVNRNWVRLLKFMSVKNKCTISGSSRRFGGALYGMKVACRQERRFAE